MKNARVLVGSCAVALCFVGCTTGAHNDLNARNGTSGYGTDTGGGPDLGGGWDDPDFGDDEPDFGSADLGGGEPELPEMEPLCTVFGQAAAEAPVAPHKKENGMWAQGSTRGCGYYALLNANIAMGADDEGGAFHAKLLACLAANAGIEEADLHDSITTKEMAAIAICKEHEMKKAGKPVRFTSHGFSAEKKFSAQCQNIKDALAAGGSAVIGFKGPAQPLGHTVRVKQIFCNFNGTDSTGVLFTDPNNPMAGPFFILIDCHNNVTEGAPAHEVIKAGVKPVLAFVEKKVEEEEEEEEEQEEGAGGE